MYYFAYGSNMDSQRMVSRGVSFSERKLGKLKGYKLVFNKISSKDNAVGFANIVQDSSSEVFGCIYKIEDTDIAKLDSFEGVPQHYERRTLPILIEEGTMVDAECYIANTSMTNSTVKPTQEYLGHLLSAKDILPQKYREELEKSVTIN